MSTLRERLRDPHGYDKPLFPRAIEDMTNDEQQAELAECRHALRINVWQSTDQIEETQRRADTLYREHPPLLPMYWIINPREQDGIRKRAQSKEEAAK